MKTQFVAQSKTSDGDFPKCLLNTVLKYPKLANPQSSLTSVIVCLLECNNSNA